MTSQSLWRMAVVLAVLAFQLRACEAAVALRRIADAVEGGKCCVPCSP